MEEFGAVRMILATYGSRGWFLASFGPMWVTLHEWSGLELMKVSWLGFLPPGAQKLILHASFSYDVSARDFLFSISTYITWEGSIFI